MGRAGALLPYCSQRDASALVQRRFAERATAPAGKRGFNLYDECDPYWLYISGNGESGTRA